MNELDDLTLIMQGKAGDTAATNALWERHQNFIRQQMAKIYAKNKGLVDRVGIDRDDLIVEGWFSVRDAVRRYDPSKRMAFTAPLILPLQIMCAILVSKGGAFAMTKQQYKIFTAVRKYKKLGKVLEVTKVGDYIKLQETVGADMLDFSDVKYNDDTDVTLSTKATDEYESRKKDNIDKAVTNLIAGYGAIVATISLLMSLSRLC